MVVYCRPRVAAILTRRLRPESDARNAPVQLADAYSLSGRRLGRPVLWGESGTLGGAYCTPSAAGGWGQCGTSSRHVEGPRPLNLTRRHGHFLNSTRDMEPSDMRTKYKGHDMGYFLNSTGDMGASQRRHGTWTLK